MRFTRAGTVGSVDMRIAVVGSRHATPEYEAFAAMLREAIDDVSPSEIVSGGAPGIDSLAREYARRNDLPLVEYRTGDERGAFAERARVRNQKIVDRADLLVAFPCPCSKGTWDTVHRWVMKSQEEMTLPRVIPIACRDDAADEQKLIAGLTKIRDALRSLREDVAAKNRPG